MRTFYAITRRFALFVILTLIVLVLSHSIRERYKGTTGYNFALLLSTGILCLAVLSGIGSSLKPRRARRGFPVEIKLKDAHNTVE